MDRPLYKPMIGTDDDVLYVQDLEKAKQLMAESKYPDGAEFDYYIGTGVGLGAQWEDTGGKIKQDLEKIGLIANISQYDWSVMDEKMYGGNFVALENWYGTNYPEAEGMMSMTVRHDSNCLQGIDGSFDFTKLEELADEALKTTDLEKRYQLYREISEIMAEDGPVAFIGQQVLKIPMRKNLHGWDKNPDYYIYDWAKFYKE
jgi:peptide/nickel transport system substrate-binding protein